MASQTLSEQVADWKRMARKHERRAKRAQALVRRLVSELRVSPSADQKVRLRQIASELESLYDEKRRLSTGPGEPFVRRTDDDAGTREVFVARRRKTRRAPDPVAHVPETW